MLTKLKALRNQAGEEGFTLIELLVVIIIIGILSAIALPLFFNQQKEGIKAGVKSDVRNTVTNVATHLVKFPTDAAINLDGDLAGPDTPVVVVKSAQTDSVVASGAWNNYTVVGTSAAAGTGAAGGEYKYTFTASSGQYTEG